MGQGGVEEVPHFVSRLTRYTLELRVWAVEGCGLLPGFEGTGVFLCPLRTRTWAPARAQVAVSIHA